MINQVYYHSAENMREIPDNSIQLIVTSPPYFNIKDYSQNGTQDQQHSSIHPDDCGSMNNYQDYLDFLLRIWKECERVLCPNGKLAINAPLLPIFKTKMSTHYNRDMLNVYGDIEQSIIQNIPNVFLLDVYIWNQTNARKQLVFGSYPYPSNLYGQKKLEFIGVFVKDGKPAKIDKDRKEQSILSKEEWLEWTKQVWNLPTTTKGDIAYGEHPAIMPEEIAHRCIRMFSFVHDIVLDPFTGSGTTLKVAKELNRKYIGYEIYNHYQNIINQKLQANTPWQPSTISSKSQLQLKFKQ